MKYKELMKVAKKNDYNIEKGVMQTIITSPGMYGSINRIAISEINIESISINARLTYSGDFEMLTSALAYAETPLGERQEEKRYIVPLPHLKTSNGEQLYLTHQGNFFPCRRDKDLRQTWKEKDLVHVPEEYRGFAVEIIEVE